MIRKAHAVRSNLTMWQEFTQLSQKYKTYHLHQGAPQFAAPRFVLDNLKKAVDLGHNQYTGSTGHPLLKE